MVRRNRLALATEQALDEPSGGGALALDQREDSIEDVLETGPYDDDDLDPEATDATGVVDFGAVQVPVPPRGTVAVEPTANGRMQAVHVALPEGRLSVSALAAPKSSKLWPELAREIDTSLREGGATVRSYPGPWGRELHANSGGAKSVFIGVDGPRWMLYGVATGPANHIETLDAELRRMLRATVVVRGRAPYPVRTVLPLVVPEHLAEAMAAAAVAKAEAEVAQAQEEAAAPAPAASAPPGASAAASGASERPVHGQVPAPPLTEQPGAVRPIEQSGAARPASPRPRPPGRPTPAPREVTQPAAWNRNGHPEIAPAPGRDHNGRAPRPDAEAGTPLWADPVQRIADADDGIVAGPEPDDFGDAPTEIWGPLPPDPTEQVVADRDGTGSRRADQVQESGGHQRTSGPVPGGFPTQPWALDPRLDDSPESWADRPELARGHAPDPGADAPTDSWPLAERYHAGPVADGPAESPSAPMRGRNGRLDGDAVTPRRRAAESEQSRPDLWAVPEPVDPAPSSGGRRALREDRLVETGEYAAPSSSGYYETPRSGARPEYSASPGNGERDYGRAAEYGDRPEYAGSPEYPEQFEYADRSEYVGSPEYGGRLDSDGRSGYGDRPEYDSRPDSAGRSERADRSEYVGSSERGDRSEFGGSPEYGLRPDSIGRSDRGTSSGYAAESEYAAPSDGSRRRALEPSDGVVGGAADGEWHTDVRAAPLTREFSFVTDTDPPVDSDDFSRPDRGRHAAPESGGVTPETTPLQVFVPPADTERPTGRHRRPD